MLTQSFLETFFNSIWVYEHQPEPVGIAPDEARCRADRAREYERMLKEKDEMIMRLETLLENGK